MIELVLARHTEDVSWVKEVLRAELTATIYNKSGHEEHGQISLENKGREGWTYLHHILENYGAFEDWTVFSQANPFDHCDNFVEILNGFPGSYRQSVFYPEVGLNFYGTNPVRPVEILAYDHYWDRAVREIWGELFYGPSPEDLFFSPCSIFSISSSLLMSRSFAFYKRAQEIIIDRPKGEWEFERLWAYLWRARALPKL